ncbi:MAG: outer membrane lipoprotein-sorting protein [Spirochaetota bacterium]
MLCVAVWVSVAFFLSAAELPRVADLMSRVEALEEQLTDLSAHVKIVQEKATQGIKAYEMQFYRRDANDNFLIVMTDPLPERGNGYLRAGDDMWMYRKNTRTFQHINRDEAISGTDAKAADFEKRKLTALYKPVTERASATNIGKSALYRFEIVNKVNDVKYPKQLYYVDRSNGLPKIVQSYSLSGALMQTAVYITWGMVEGKYIWLKATFIDEFEKGNRSVVELSGISTKPISHGTFTKAYLENLSK